MLQPLQTWTEPTLLAAFAAAGDEDAFAEVVRRHRTLVYRTCYRRLGDPHEAEDAVQAVFVILARKAAGLTTGNLSAWLYVVAQHVAAEAVRKRQRRTRRHEAYALTQTLGRETGVDEDTHAAVLNAVDGELLALGGRSREAVILLYLQGHSQEEAAAIAGCPVGTLSARASRAIVALRKRLARRGVALGAAALTGVLTAEASAAVPETLLSSSILTLAKSAATTGWSGAAATATSTTTLILAKGAMKTMFLTKMANVAAGLTIGAAILCGALTLGLAVARTGDVAQSTLLTPYTAPGLAEATQVRFIRLKYDGPGWDDGLDAASGADRNFLERLAKVTGLKAAAAGESQPITGLRDYPQGAAPPFVYLTGTGDITVSADEVKALQAYLADGGLLFADCGSTKWDASFRRLLQAVFPGASLRDIPNDDPLFREPYVFANGAPPLLHYGGTRALGIEQAGRWVVFYHPGDLNDAWKTGHSGLAAATADRAFALGINVVAYALRQRHPAAAMAATPPPAADEVEAMLRRASDLYKQKQYREAGALFAQVQQEFPYHPKAPPALVLAAQCQMQLKDWNAASQILEGFEQAYPAKLEDWQAAASQPFDLVVRAHAAAQTVRPEVLYWLGDVYTTTQDHRRAYETFKVQTRDYPESQWAKYARGRLAQPEFQNLETGNEKGRPAAEQAPESGSLLQPTQLRADKLTVRHDGAATKITASENVVIAQDKMEIKAPELVIQLSPPEVEDSDLAAMLNGEPAAAAPDDVAAMFRPAIALFQQQQYQEAKAIFSRIQQKDPYHPAGPAALLLAGLCQMKLANWEAANQVFDLLVSQQIYPANLDAWKVAGQPLQRVIKTHTAAAKLRPEAMYWRGDSYAKLKDYRQAYRAFKMLIEDYPESKWANYARGRLAEKEFQGWAAENAEDAPAAGKAADPGH